MIRRLWWYLVWQHRFKWLLAQAVEMQCSRLVVFLGNDGFHVMGYDYHGLYARDLQGYMGHISWKDLSRMGTLPGRRTFENWQTDLDQWADSYESEQTFARIARLRHHAQMLGDFVMVKPRGYNRAPFMTSRFTVKHGARIPGEDANLVWFMSDYANIHRMRAYLPFELDLADPNDDKLANF